jgi:hypothetical protein
MIGTGGDPFAGGIAMSQWINRRVLAVAGIVVVLIVGFFALRWLINKPAESVIGAISSKSIAAAWANAISQFAIEPVFPPEEDLTVGDVLAYVVADNDPDLLRVEQVEAIDARSPFLRRAVKLAHANVRKVLEETYSQLPVFPVSANVPVGDKPRDPDAKPVPAVARLFSGEVPESYLPRVAIPTIKTEGKNSAGGAVIANGQGSASFVGGNEGSEVFHLSDTSTYGLPSARAMEALKSYCLDERTKDDCRESTVRRYLQPIIGDRIYARYLDPQGREFYPVQVGLVIVSRVYLARSIVYRIREGRAQNLGVFASLFQGAGDNADNAAPEPPPLPPSGGDGATDDALRKRIDDLENQVKRMRSGAGFSSRSSTSAETAFDTGQLVRPVAVGFRYVQFEFPKDENKTKDEKQ